MPDEAFDGMPEVMASLRSFGSRRHARGGTEHLPFFTPLLDARRAATAATSRADAIAAFDAAQLVRALDRAVADFAEARFPGRPPARRALAAELADASAPLRAALVRLGALASAAQGNANDESWRAWVEQLRACFATADSLWPVLDAALAAPTTGEAKR